MHDDLLSDLILKLLQDEIDSIPQNKHEMFSRIKLKNATSFKDYCKRAKRSKPEEFGYESYTQSARHVAENVYRYSALPLQHQEAVIFAWACETFVRTNNQGAIKKMIAEYKIAGKVKIKKYVEMIQNDR